MAGTLSRFFASTAATGAFARIRADAQLVAKAQTLYEQILPSAALSRGDESNARSGDSEPDKIWALVAVVATGMTHEMQQEKEQKEAHQVQPLAWNLVQLLAEAGVGLQEFLLYFTSLFNRLLLEPELLAATTLLKEEFTIATLLFEKYRVLWESLTKRKSKEHSDPEPESYVDDQQQRELRARHRHRTLFEGGWLVFLLAKRRLGAHYSGLGQLYNLLLAALHLVITNAQASQASVEAEVAAALSAMGSLGDGKASPVKSGAGVKTSAQILEALCRAPKVDPADVSRASGHLCLVLQQLRDENVLRKEAGEHSVLSMALFADPVLDANVARLSERYYDDYLDGCGKLDERFFLDAGIRRTIMGTNLTAQSDNGTNASSAAPTSSNSRLNTTRSGTHAMLSPVRRNMMARRRENNAAAVARGTMTPPRHHQHGRGVNSPLMHSWQWQGSPGGARLLPPGVSPRPSPSSMRTPVSAAVETSNWVRETLSSTMLTPVTPQLREFFSDCAVDPTDRIERVLREHSELLLAARTTSRVTSSTVRSARAIIIDDDQGSNADENGSGRNSQFPSGVDDSLKRTKNLAVVLFYRVLEPLLLSERERLRNNDFSKLLNNEVFLAALFACSAEVVLKAHSLITISYPFLLDHLHVNAFHFVTTSESFVKYAPKLPAALKKHMGDVKNRILDSHAWRSDSALYQLLAGASRPPISAPSTPLATASPSTPRLTERLNGNGAASPGAAGHAPVLRLFFRMVLSRAASRIYQLCHLLGLDSTDQNQIWTAVKECITSHHYLLRDRHLDLIVLCNIYAVCKVSRPSASQAATTMSFKRLLACYKQLNRQTPTGMNTSSSSIISSRIGEGVTHNIKLDGEHSRGDIIKFYNRCYITPMKVFILQFQFQESQMAAADAVVAEASGTPHALTPGFTPRREGSSLGLSSSTSDAESIARAASEAVLKLLPAGNRSYGPANDRSRVLPSTPPRSIRRGVRSSPFVSSPAVSALQMFTSAEVQTLPVSMHQTSPKRIQASNVFMSPLQQVRLDRRSEMTPRSHALYAFGESPARDLALINRAVNAAPASLRRTRGPPELVIDSDTEQDVVSASPGATPVRKKQKTVS